MALNYKQLSKLGYIKPGRQVRKYQGGGEVNYDPWEDLDWFDPNYHLIWI